MSKIKKNDIVCRKSYGGDILFNVERIIKLTRGKEYAILKGITVRIEADAPVSDLKLVERERVEKNLRSLDSRMENRIQKKCNTNKKRGIYNISNTRTNTGKILHLDGDKRYSEKSMKYYKSLGLNAVVKNVAENRQPQVIRNLLERYEPDILVLTGHDRNDKKRNRI